MASYDHYDRDYPRQYVREERREPARDRFLDPRDFAKTHSRDLVPRQDSDVSVEEIRRDFPPPTGRDIRRARSVGPWDDDYGRPRGYAGPERYDSRYDYERDRDYDRRHHRGPSNGSRGYHDEERSKKDKAKAKQEKIIAAVAGAALLVGGKELFDRHEAKEGGSDVHRNPLSSAALAGFGALAGYQGAEFYSKQQAKKDQKANLLLHRGRDGQLNEYYSDEEDGKEKKSNKNFLESALAATGLGAAVKQFTGGGGDDKQSRRGSPTRSRAGSKERGGAGNKIQKAAMASLLAGATEAFRVAKEPGGWRGEKAKRVFTAAAGAATVDAAHGGDKGTFGLAESVIGGLVGNRLINGSKKDIEEDEKTGRSRSRSRAPSKSGSGGGGTGLAALATAGLGAFGAKKILDRSRSGSRSRSRRDHSYDSRNPSPDRRRQRSRSRSVVDRARNSLAKLGIGSTGAAAADDYHRRDQDDFDDGHRHRSRRHSDDYDDRDGRDSRDGRNDRGDRGDRGARSDRDDRDYARAPKGGRDRSASRSHRRGGRSDYGSDSDLGDSDDDKKRAKKMRGVATIHAAHEIFESLEKRKARQKAVKDGHLSQVDAKKLKTKAIIKDATAVGIAAMGIKSVFNGVKEAKELQHECKTFQEERALRHEKRERRRKRQELGPRRRSGSLPAPRKQTLVDWQDGIPRYDDGYFTRHPAAPPLRHREP
ncbi:hypothetical protein CCM_01110 [Cordyceps militaris CM01]|uniref:DUF3824 domain-containing protein n=1 Tax=Cordyceps militaris (strain CM01) TaxID=983644 RepID=G3J373_CORMM|nr:uncharacterized protein CCM_01110 [Cordyceps militaris CM01]EGX96454.1 hypothetical protein CCM_01110 [Cordyceps militaris CM01]